MKGATACCRGRDGDGAKILAASTSSTRDIQSMANTARVKTKSGNGASGSRGAAGVRTRIARNTHFTHFDDAGQAHMVDVAAKDVTKRVARAGGRIVMQPETLALIRRGGAKKGDVLGVARIAAIQAAKRASKEITAS